MTQPLFTTPVQPADTDERYTPPWLFEELGWFDLDPCSPEGGPLHAHARRWFTAVDDGLSQPWDGLVFLNPPFSNPTPWADRFAGHANGVAILPYSNSAWRVRMFRTVDMLFAPADLRFVGQTHEQQRVSMPVFFAAYGDGTERLVRLVRSGRLGGTALERAF